MAAAEAEDDKKYFLSQSLHNARNYQHDNNCYPSSN